MLAPTPKPLLCYFVTSDRHDEGLVIRFAKSSVAARREGAHELDEYFSDVHICRVPTLDRYAPHACDIPPKALLALGLAFECACRETVSENYTPALCYGPDGVPYCGPACLEKSAAECA